jgi:hypothetical protein
MKWREFVSVLVGTALTAPLAAQRLPVMVW